MATDAVWTKQRLFTHEMASDPICVNCGEAPDTPHHRAWVCPCSAEVRARYASLAQIKRARAAPNSLMWSRGWIPGVAELAPAPADLELRAWTRDDGETPLHSVDQWAGTMTQYIFIDGSCDTPNDHRMRRAGWAAVEVEPYLINGQLVRRRAVWGTIPSAWPQTSQAAEHAAAVAAAELGSGTATIFTDCLGVMKLMQDLEGKSLHQKKMWAGAYRLAHATTHGPKLMKSMVKVKAHQQMPDHEQPAERLRRLANDLADEYAKKGAELHPRPVPAVRAWQDAVWLDAVAACRTLGAATQLWPDASGLRDVPRQPRTRALRREQARARKQRAQARRMTRRDGDRAQRATHEWVLVGGSRRCAVCHRWDGARVGPCNADQSPWLQLQDRARDEGHNMREGLLYDAHVIAQAEAAARQAAVRRAAGIVDARPSGGLPIAICMGCGAFTTAGGRPQSLLGPCHAPTAVGKSALDRVRRGMHPKAGRHPPRCVLLPQRT